MLTKLFIETFVEKENLPLQIYKEEHMIPSDNAVPPLVGSRILFLM